MEPYDSALGPGEAQSVGSQGRIRRPGGGIYKNPVEAVMVRATVVLTSRFWIFWKGEPAGFSARLGLGRDQERAVRDEWLRGSQTELLEGGQFKMKMS